ncbi:MAG: DUF418 domain-containing protein [Rhodoferax sp.]|nr:DUF418 domain-containing protein [Rhodoferax sp.]
MNSNSSTTLSPPVSQQRIEALDVVRGFALLGIFLMNIEFFNRSITGIGLGMPQGLTGLDWLASWFIAYFVQGKFWTIFSLLFGMGFAVMLTRAEHAGRDFLAPYMRRILGLAVFGAAHYIFLWSGDILFSYAVGAGALLILLYGKWKQIALALAVLVGIGFIPGLDPVFGIAGALAFVSLLSVYLRVERRVSLRGRSVPLFSFILLVLGALAAIAAVVLWVLPNGPKEPRIPVTIASVVFMVLGALSARFHEPASLRELRLGVSVYTFAFLMMTVGGAAQYFAPREPATAPAATAVTAANDNKKSEPTEAEKTAKKKKERAARLAQREEDVRNEVRILSSGRYAEAVEMRARRFPEKVAGDAGFATVLIAMFLLGSWFVRSGVMANTGAHLPLFRKLAYVALPFGIGLGLAGSLIAVSHVPGDDFDGFQLARGLTMLGNLPACLGYVGVVVLMLHSKSAFSKISLLAPVGRMALTNYLAQSVICSLYFYGYGLGHWGMPRAWQVVFVLVVFAAQVAFSHWWLARMRFGPMEWLWRAFTYRPTPPMRLRPFDGRTAAT